MNIMTKKYKILFTIRRILIFILFGLFICCAVFMLNGYMEKGAVNSEINKFRKRGVFFETTTIQGQTVDIYKVYKEYDYEDLSKPVFDSSINSKYYIGSKTDIILTTRNPLRRVNTAIVRDVAGYFSENFFIGHATINIEDDGSKIIESVGNDEDFAGVRIKENQWVYTEVRYGNDAQTIVGLRLKEIDEQTKENICNNLKELEGKKYNYLLPFYAKNKYYCTDLISRTLKKENININYDSFYTTGNDIIVSNSTYVIFLCERIEDGHFKIYYLSEE